MTKIKKSFFEKLTGARRIDDDDLYEPERPIERGHEQPLKAFYEEEREETFVQPTTNHTYQREEPAYDNTDNSEGQLTIDVYQTDNDIVIKSTIAGVKPEDLDVSINNDMITIRGERRQDEQIPSENYYYQECYWGGFSRSVILPVDILPDKVEASMKNGILTVRLPKADTTRTKKIQVRGF
jgi:HSP20 family protein